MLKEPKREKNLIEDSKRKWRATRFRMVPEVILSGFKKNQFSILFILKFKFMILFWEGSFN